MCIETGVCSDADATGTLGEAISRCLMKNCGFADARVRVAEASAAVYDQPADDVFTAGRRSLPPILMSAADRASVGLIKAPSARGFDVPRAQVKRCARPYRLHPTLRHKARGSNWVFVDKCTEKLLDEWVFRRGMNGSCRSEQWDLLLR